MLSSVARLSGETATKGLVVERQMRLCNDVQTGLESRLNSVLICYEVCEIHGISYICNRQNIKERSNRIVCGRGTTTQGLMRNWRACTGSAAKNQGSAGWSVGSHLPGGGCSCDTACMCA